MLGRGGLSMFSQRGAGGPPDPSAGYALYLDFKNSLYRSGSTKSAAISAMPGYSMTQTGAASEVPLVAGTPLAFGVNTPRIVPGVGYWARAATTNLLLNAGAATTLGTQTTAALTAAPYTIYFEGTGSVALSGSFTGSLAGTGVNNMVALTFTPTAAALTVTVTGSVTYAGLVLGAFPAGSAIIATAGATAGIGADALTTTANPYTTDQGFIIWGVVNFGEAPVATHFDPAFVIGANGIYAYRDTSGLLQVFANGGTKSSGVTVAGTGRAVIMYRRKAGIDTAAVKVGSTVTIGSSFTLAWVAPTTALAVGTLVGSDLLNGNVEGVFAQTGTFSDAQITTILTAA